MNVLHPIQSQLTATIASGQTTSGVVNLSGLLPVCLQMPATFTGTTVTFQGSFDGTVFQPINAGGVAYTETVTTSVMVVLDPTMFQGLKQIKIVSGATEGTTRAIGVMLRGGD